MLFPHSFQSMYWGQELFLQSLPFDPGLVRVLLRPFSLSSENSTPCNGISCNRIIVGTACLAAGAGEGVAGEAGAVETDGTRRGRFNYLLLPQSQSAR